MANLICILSNMLQNQSLALLMLGSLLGWGMAPELHPDDWMGQKFKLTNFAVPNNMNSMRYALKSVPEAFSSGHRIIIDMGAFH